eukprot:9327982-Ditylum_brightwellii.AAC.1
MKQEGILAHAIKANNDMYTCHVCEFGGIEAYIFGKYELAADLALKRQEVENKMSRSTRHYGVTDFYDGLTFLAMAHKTNSSNWGFLASKAMVKIERYVQNGNINCEHRLLLFQAETKSLLGHVKDASSDYDLAIAAAEKHGFINEHAIANERAGDFCLRNGDPRASQYYGKASALYIEWGAQGKADDLCKNIPF